MSEEIDRWDIQRFFLFNLVHVPYLSDIIALPFLPQLKVR